MDGETSEGTLGADESLAIGESAFKIKGLGELAPVGLTNVEVVSCACAICVVEDNITVCTTCSAEEVESVCVFMECPTDCPSWAHTLVAAGAVSSAASALLSVPG